MRVLLDECVPRPLRRELSQHAVRTVPEMGWAGKRNGELLGLIKSAGFVAFITTDQNFEHQQNLQTAAIPLIVLVARSNKLRALLPLLPEVRLALDRARPGTIIRVGA